MDVASLRPQAVGLSAAWEIGSTMGVQISTKRRPIILLGLLALQAAAAAYFLTDAIGELPKNPRQMHPLTESPVAVALGIGIAFSVAEVRRTLRRMHEQEEALDAMRNAHSGGIRSLIPI